MRAPWQARKTAMKVTRGKVRRKNRTALTPGAVQGSARIRRKPPFRGHRHVVTIGELRKFLALLVEWQPELAALNEIILDRGDSNFDASYSFFRVCIKLQPWQTLTPLWDGAHVEGHESILSRLKVPLEPDGDSFVCHFTRDTARAYMLLHVFLHEIGHHLYFVRNGITSERSEKHAEEFALRFEGVMWDRYVEQFGDPRGCGEARDMDKNGVGGGANG